MEGRGSGSADSVNVTSSFVTYWRVGSKNGHVTRDIFGGLSLNRLTCCSRQVQEPSNRDGFAESAALYV